MSLLLFAQIVILDASGGTYIAPHLGELVARCFADPAIHIKLGAVFAHLL